MGENAPPNSPSVWHTSVWSGHTISPQNSFLDRTLMVITHARTHTPFPKNFHRMKSSSRDHSHPLHHAVEMEITLSREGRKDEREEEERGGEEEEEGGGGGGRRREEEEEEEEGGEEGT